MSNVTGQIGDQQVNLENAATEATLNKLLQATVAAGLKNKEDLKKLAQAAGLNVSETAESLKDLSAKTNKQSEEFKKLSKNAEDLRQKQTLFHSSLNSLVEGTSSASGIFKTFANDSTVVGLVFQGLAKAAAMQEKNFEVYQQISNAGASFAGSLTDLRTAAAKSYLTIDQFSSLIKSNSAAFLQITGSVNGGVIAFSKFSSQILNSQAGNDLMALGYTAQEANQGMLTYLAASGVSNAKELETNKALREGAVQYLEELDRLAEVTGKSREEQNELMKKQQLDAEIQTTAARMAPEIREKFLANVQYMTQQYGTAGRDMALAQAQGRAVITKEGQMLSALAPGMTSAYANLTKYAVGSKEYIKAQNNISLAAQQGLNQVSPAVLGFVKGIDQAQLTVAKQTQAGLNNEEAFAARDKKIADERAARATSQASEMAELNKGFRELGASLIDSFSLPISIVTGILGVFGKTLTFLSSLVSSLNGLFGGFGKLITVLGIAISAVIARMAFKSAVSGIASVGASVLGGAGEAVGGSGAIVGKGVGGVGSVLGGIGKGAGEAVGGLAEGLKKLGDPRALLGVASLVGLGAAVYVAANAFKEFSGVNWGSAFIGIGVMTGLAAAAALAAPVAPAIIFTSVAFGMLGLALVAMGTGLQSIQKSGGGNGLGALGMNLADFISNAPYGRMLLAAPGMSAFGLSAIPLSLGLIALGKGYGTVAEGLQKLNQVDPAKLAQVAAGMQKIKEASPGVGQTIVSGFVSLVTKAFGPNEKSDTVATASNSSPVAAKEEINLGTEVKKLNNTMMEMLRVIKESNDHAKQNVSATKALNRNVFPS